MPDYQRRPAPASARCRLCELPAAYVVEVLRRSRSGNLKPLSLGCHCGRHTDLKIARLIAAADKRGEKGG
jgi:hypothetical protein